jgi:hypothetical protein
VRVKATGLGTYPDATVVCDSIETDPEDPKGQMVINPTLIVEVLSPSTESYDRGEKLEHYQRIPSLKEVVLVAHDARRVEIWRRSGDNWAREDYTGDATAELRSIECVLSLGENLSRSVGRSISNCGRPLPPRSEELVWCARVGTFGSAACDCAFGRIHTSETCQSHLDLFRSNGFGRPTVVGLLRSLAQPAELQCPRRLLGR